MTQILIPVSSATGTSYFLSLSGQAFQGIVRLASILNHAIANQATLSFLRGWRFSATAGGLNLRAPSFSSFDILKPVLSFLQSNLPHLQAACGVPTGSERPTALTRTCLSALQDFVGGLHAHYVSAAAVSSASVAGSNFAGESTSLARAIESSTGASTAAVAHELQNRALPTLLKSAAAVLLGVDSAATRTLKSMPPAPPEPVPGADGSGGHMIAWIVLSVVLILVIACVICAAVFCVTKALRRRRVFHHYELGARASAVLPISHAHVSPAFINMSGASPTTEPIQAAVSAAPIFYQPLVRPASYEGGADPAACAVGLTTPASFYKDVNPEIPLDRASCPPTVIVDRTQVMATRGGALSCPPASETCLQVHRKPDEGRVSPPTGMIEAFAGTGVPTSPGADPCHFTPIGSPIGERAVVVSEPFPLRRTHHVDHFWSNTSP